MCMGEDYPKLTSGLLSPGSKARILVSRTDRIGDLVLSLPVVRSLNNMYPHARIELLIQKYTAPVVRQHEGIADLLLWDPQSGNRGLVSALTARKYDVVISLYPRSNLARAFAWAKIPIRIGSGRRWYSFFYTHRVHISRRDSGRHEKDLNLDLLTPLGIKPDYSLIPKLMVNPNADFPLPDFLERFINGPRPNPLVVVHPGDGGSALNWPIKRYSELARLLAEKKNTVVITGLAEERERHLAEFANTVGEENILSGRTELSQLMRVLAGADLFVGGSTGPLHLAAALQVPVVGLYGPIRTTTPDRWGPCGTDHRVFVPNVPICDCKVDSCRLGNCVDRIPLQDVFDACMDLVLRSNTSTCCQPINKTSSVSDVTPREI